MQRIRFRDVNDRNCMVSVPVNGQEKPVVLRMWVAYDRGRRYSQYDYAEVKRGYYLYFSFEELSTDYPARILSTHRDNCRVFLGEVKRRSEGWHRDFSNLAGEIAEVVIHDILAGYDLDWNNLSDCWWSGRGSGVGMFCDFYQIIMPKREWLYGQAQ